MCSRTVECAYVTVYYVHELYYVYIMEMSANYNIYHNIVFFPITRNQYY